MRQFILSDFTLMLVLVLGTFAICYALGRLCRWIWQRRHDEERGGYDGTGERT